MKKSRYTDEQIVFALKQAETGTPVSAVALPLAPRWYPPEHQGKAMGVAGMGNSGTVLVSLFATLLAKEFGWNAVLGLAVIPLAIVFVLYMAIAKDSLDQPAPKPFAAYLSVLKEADT